MNERLAGPNWLDQMGELEGGPKQKTGAWVMCGLGQAVN